MLRWCMSMKCEWEWECNIFTHPKSRSISIIIHSWHCILRMTARLLFTVQFNSLWFLKTNFYFMISCIKIPTFSYTLFLKWLQTWNGIWLISLKFKILSHYKTNNYEMHVTISILNQACDIVIYTLRDIFVHLCHFFQ